ncbi:cation:proton antiporter [Corynebacterium pseudotuberculosis]|uniref:Cation:proton antiporter n=2 Tax=Corynebacterium pseudotuberculosis TaxID=1719 RepID=D9QDW2_CORP2|nr:cation:proton antiporter [Corynebacterium pseudotuberculosis]AER68296.1 Na(+)/H(+) antiporter subunit F [Corynebacterium pseudotuberculosis 1/06-A]ADK27979.1 cation:proton antiporter [Corynebacterium pseudotuberculosis FRC41]ADL09685.1 cation:proton antiporter [Corynebacterium pseudotuberculosis C231]ADL20091.1 cation:proton antiporter [Corynebacterium pseudotuberculosis 1002]ADO25481.1 cation:proton antiporter [Corynebacterium pseudotuberculosis I19]
MFLIASSIGMAATTIGIIATIILMIRTKDQLTRAVISDMVFYSMIGFYIIWCMANHTQINYEIALLAALVGGILPTMSVARIISKGRR